MPNKVLFVESPLFPILVSIKLNSFIESPFGFAAVESYLTWLVVWLWDENPFAYESIYPSIPKEAAENRQARIEVIEYYFLRGC